MRWVEGFIAVDWGTTNRRAYVIGSDGRCVEEMEDDKGILTVPQGAFAQAVQEIRGRLGDKPLLLAGMIGSNRGWIEAPYVPCPAGSQEIASRLTWAENERTAIVPGVSFVEGEVADVMRGEEVQILGALAAGEIAEDSLVCHPGTHNKWIRVEAGRIVWFTTVMTGELFNLLRDRSILADLLRGPVEPDQAFGRGVQLGLDGAGLTSELFRIRAGVLLGCARADDAPSFASGLLIGADLRTGLAEATDGKDVVVMGRPELTRLYVEALRIAGRKGTEMDGESAFVAGARKIVESIE
jgi:2-dehydro-3-deoxygalactonokinase